MTQPVPPLLSRVQIGAVGLAIAAAWTLSAATAINLGGSLVLLVAIGGTLAVVVTWMLVAVVRQSQTQFRPLEKQLLALQTQLLTQRAQTAIVVENLGSGVIVVSRHGQVLLANSAAKRLFAIHRQPVGHPLVESIRQPELFQSIGQLFVDRGPRETLIEVRDDAGARRVLRVRCVSITYEGAPAVLLEARDETENRYLEEMRREFVANLSHELKTPLAAIKGYAETVELAIGDDPQAALHFIEQILEQCRRLERLIADMMTLARAQAGVQYLRLATVDLDAVMAEAITTYAPIAAAKSIRLEYQANDPPVMIYADREATLTIANNLIGNAIRYTPEGGEVVAHSHREGAFGVLSVRDNGVGIPEHEQKRIFERFYRGDKARHRSSKGTGLGLAIVKNLTQAQGGRIELQSRPNHGSTFKIYLPAASPAQTNSTRSP